MCVCLYINLYLNITELKNKGVKLCQNPQFFSATTTCVLIQIMVNEIFLDLIHVIERLLPQSTKIRNG